MAAPAAAPAPAPAASVAAAPPAPAEEKVLNIYNWPDYIPEGMIAAFEKETGIKVNYDTFETNEALNAKLVAGKGWVSCANEDPEATFDLNRLYRECRWDASQARFVRVEVQQGS